MSTTIKDIARNAGVSHSTVSRALHHSTLISDETTQRILRIASDLNYQPSFAARSLKTNRSQALGVIVSQIDDPFFSEILQGIDDVAQANGYNLFIATSQQDPARESKITRAMREHRVDGVILCSPRFTAEQSSQLNSYEIPVVAINNQANTDYMYSIYHDDVDGGMQVSKHLIELGHTNIGYLGDASSGRTTRERLTGVKKVLSEHGIELRPSNIHQVDGNSSRDGYIAAEYFTNLLELPTAIICYNDMLALGVLKALREAAVEVPGDISITGFDNILVSDFASPPLTTIDQPKRLLGAEAAKMMLEQLNSPGTISPPEVTRMQGMLLIRQSTGSPRRK